jgi:TIGR03009 family protein
MRALYLTFSALLLGAAAVHAQLPPATPQSPADPRLDQVLANWERSMTELTSFQATCVRTRLDKSFNSREEYEGKALFLKAAAANQPSRALLELANKKKKEIFEKYVCTGTFLYEYQPAEKLIRVHDMPQTKSGGIGDDNFLQFLFGMKAAEAKERYHMIYVPAPATDKWYHYLRILAKQPQDKADFSEARLVLMADTFLPRQLWYQQPNGNEITWDFPKVERNVNIPLSLFDAPRQLPPDWQMRRVEARNLPPANVPPTVVRPQNR